MAQGCNRGGAGARAWWDGGSVVGVGRAYALKAGEATTTAKKNLSSVDGMANIMVRHPSHDAYPSCYRGLFGISLTETAQNGGGWGLRGVAWWGAEGAYAR
jgi:hypothetical protein